MTTPRQHACPTCKKRGDWHGGKFAPFCSSRCRLIDLGQWLNEAHVIPTRLTPEHLEGFAELPPGPQLDAPQEED